MLSSLILSLVYSVAPDNYVHGYDQYTTHTSSAQYAALTVAASLPPKVIDDLQEEYSARIVSVTKESSNIIVQLLSGNKVTILTLNEDTHAVTNVKN